MHFDQVLEQHGGFAMSQAKRFFSNDLGATQRQDLAQAALEGLLVASVSVDWAYVNEQRNPSAFFLTIARRHITPLLVAQASQNRPTSIGCGCGADVCARCRAKAASDALRRASGTQLPRRSHGAAVLDALDRSVPLHDQGGALTVDPSDTARLAAGESDELDLLNDIYDLIADLSDGRDQEVMRLAYVEGLDDEAIAKRLAVSRRTVRRLRTAATDQVRALLLAQQTI